MRAKIDKSEKYDFSDITTIPIESIGIIYNLPITLALGFTIHDNFFSCKLLQANANIF